MREWEREREREHERDLTLPRCSSPVLPWGGLRYIDPIFVRCAPVGIGNRDIEQASRLFNRFSQPQTRSCFHFGTICSFVLLCLRWLEGSKGFLAFFVASSQRYRASPNRNSNQLANSDIVIALRDDAPWCVAFAWPVAQKTWHLPQHRLSSPAPWALGVHATVCDTPALTQKANITMPCL